VNPVSIDDLAAYLDGSPSPFHAVASTAAQLLAAGFSEVSASDEWEPLGTGFIRRGGALIAWRGNPGAASTTPFRIVGAHTDSPGLRIKPMPDTGLLGWRQLGVEVYGGALLNSWLDRDLGLAGRLALKDGSNVMVSVDRPVARVPQLAIHLDREVSDKGLLLDKQAHLTPIWGTGSARTGEFAAWIAGLGGVAVGDVAGWELQLFDLTPAGLLGQDRTLFASGRLDNQLSCWAATAAMAGASASGQFTSVIALFDHEEVGSESTTGAAGPLLQTVLERLVISRGGSREDMHRAFATSHCVSADNAHAVHPNYPERHEPGHRPMVNEGPAIKLNSNQRYATSSTSAVPFQQACAAAAVPWQTFVSRNNMPCGSTIGPITSTRLGIETVDIGVPQLSMHSARELCGAADPVYLAKALGAYLS
jgi:aspartyl aminopeptidase